MIFLRLYNLLGTLDNGGVLQNLQYRFSLNAIEYLFPQLKVGILVVGLARYVILCCYFSVIHLGIKFFVFFHQGKTTNFLLRMFWIYAL